MFNKDYGQNYKPSVVSYQPQPGFFIWLKPLLSEVIFVLAGLLFADTLLDSFGIIHLADFGHWARTGDWCNSLMRPPGL